MLGVCVCVVVIVVVVAVVVVVINTLLKMGSALSCSCSSSYQLTWNAISRLTGAAMSPRQAVSSWRSVQARFSVQAVPSIQTRIACLGACVCVYFSIVCVIICVLFVDEGEKEKRKIMSHNYSLMKDRNSHNFGIFNKAYDLALNRVSEK